MQFGMIVNPTAGPTNVNRKARTLQAVKEILGDCEIRGLDTRSREEFMACAAELAREVEVLIVAGGDGSFSDAINALDNNTTFSYLPLGSGCALQYALDLPPQLTRTAKRIKEGRLHLYDLILCDELRTRRSWRVSGSKPTSSIAGRRCGKAGSTVRRPTRWPPSARFSPSWSGPT